MTIGDGGRYDARCEDLQRALGGSVLLLVIGGGAGSGFSLCVQPEDLAGLVHVLRSTADQIEADQLQLTSTREGVS